MELLVPRTNEYDYDFIVALRLAGNIKNFIVHPVNEHGTTLTGGVSYPGLGSNIYGLFERKGTRHKIMLSLVT